MSTSFNLPTSTLGGKQYWGDEQIYGGWRIQRNVFTGHHRLLDAHDIRRAWGSLETCDAALDKARREGKAQVRSTTLCLLLHGYMRSKDSLRPLQRALHAQGWEVCSVNYPSMVRPIEEIALQVGRVMRHALQDFDTLHVVTHSLGGIIARACMCGEDWQGRGRLVMLAPPNQGANLADIVLGWWPSQWVVGPVGKQLIAGSAGFCAGAGIPCCEFGVIAGSLRNGVGINPLIQGDDDGTVGVEQTKLEGMSDFITVNAQHTLIMRSPEVHRQVLHFLRRGQFEHQP